MKNIRPFGAFIEIGGGMVGLLHIEDISVSRIKSPFDRFEIGQDIDVMVKNIDEENNRISFTYKELLGTLTLSLNSFNVKPKSLPSYFSLEISSLIADPVLIA